MKTEAHLKGGWILFSIDYGEESPLEDHEAGKIGILIEEKKFFTHKETIISHGLEAIRKICNEFIDQQSS